MPSVIFGIALNTWKQMVRDRIFYVVLVVAFIILGFSYLLASLSIIEQRKVLLDFCFSAISIASGFTAVYIGIVAVAREIEQRTIYTIVSKPVSRSTYLLGKFVGCLFVLAASHTLLSLNVIAVLWLMGEAPPPGFTACVFLVFLESSILLGFAFLSSSFTTSMVAVALTVAFFLIGRSVSSFQVMSERALTPGTKAFSKVLYYVAPNLERFNIRDVVAYGRPYPEEMLWLGIAYAAAYLLVCISASCMIISARDLP